MLEATCFRMPWPVTVAKGSKATRLSADKTEDGPHAYGYGEGGSTNR